MKRYTLFCLTLLSSIFCFAQTITVCNSGCNYTSIKTAVTAAAAGSTIVVSTGTFTDNSITVNKNLTIRGSGMTTTVVQGHASRATSSARVFYVTNEATVTIEDLTVQHGYETGAGGGGILIDGNITSLTLNRVYIKNNDCVSPYAGAGVFLNAASSSATTSLYVNNCKFEGNINNGGTGGALYLGSSGTASVKGTTFLSNQASSGAAISLAGVAAPSVINSTFTSNSASSGSGGAISGTSSLANFTSCTFESNSATVYGGAARIGPTSFTNCTFYGNTATQGGAIFRSGTNTSPANIINCTIVGNTATSATTSGGGLNYTTSSGGVINLINTVIASNTGTVGADLYFTDGSFLSNNTTNYVRTAAFGFNAKTFTLSSGTAFSSPALASNGGLTKTISTPAGSVLINAGTASVSSFTIPNKDQRNYQRAGTIDIGAFENGASDGLSISYTTLANTSSASDRTLSATISDNIGVATSSTTKPKVYYKKSTSSSWLSNQGALSTGSATSGTWDFTIQSAQLGTINNGDQIQYFVVAQDNTTGAYAKSNSSGLLAGDVNSIGTFPTPNSYAVTLGTLPVRLISFTATKKDAKVELSWSTADETNARSFLVEGSSDGQTWATLSEVKATGNSSSISIYRYEDQRSLEGNIYYRLKQVDQDGNHTYSDVRKVAGGIGRVSVYPNPITTEKLTVELSSMQRAPVSYRLINSAGIVVKEGNLNNRIEKVEVSSHSRGIYLLQLSTGESFKIEKK